MLCIFIIILLYPYTMVWLILWYIILKLLEETIIGTIMI